MKPETKKFLSIFIPLYITSRFFVISYLWENSTVNMPTFIFWIIIAQLCIFGLVVCYFQLGNLIQETKQKSGDVKYGTSR